MKPLEAMNIIKALNVKDIELARYFHDLDETISVHSWQVWLNNGQYFNPPITKNLKTRKIASLKREIYLDNIACFLEDRIREINTYTGKYEIVLKRRDSD